MLSQRALSANDRVDGTSWHAPRNLASEICARNGQIGPTNLRRLLFGTFFVVTREINRGAVFQVYPPALVSPEMLQQVLQPPATLLRGIGEWVAVYQQFRDKIAVVLTDMDMHVMDGPSTVLALNRINPRVKISESSGLFPNPKLEATLGASVVRFVSKPYRAESLLRAVMEALLTPSIQSPTR